MTSGPAAQPGGRDLSLIRNPDGRARFYWRDGKLYQRSILWPDREWEMSLVKDSVDPDHPNFNAVSSRSKTVDGKRHRDSLTLVIKDFDGPGTYELTGMNSNFTSVGLNLGGLEGGDEGASDAAAEQLLRDALSGSKVLLLQGAQVEIRSVDAKQVEGRFSWKDPTGRSSLTDGVFRAIVKKPRKKKERKRE